MTPDDDDHRPNPGRSAWRGRLPMETETAWFLLVSVLDVVCTYLLLASGRFRESNAVADWFIAGWGITGMVWFKMALSGFVCVVAQVVATRRPRAGRFLLILGTAVTGAVVLYSVALGLRHL